MERNTLVFAIGTIVAGIVLLMQDAAFVGGLVVSIFAFSALWVVSLALRNASIVDVFWGPGFVIVGAYYLTTPPAASTARGWLVLSLVTLWALRLALHIGGRNARSGEDFRYRRWREEAGSRFWWISYFKVFLLQAVVLWIVSSPIKLAHLGGGTRAWTALDLCAVAIWIVGFLFEAIADWQLARFKSSPNNSGKVLHSGLWSLSRHPNYFGEALLWWGIGLLAFPVGGWPSFLGPLMLTFLLLKVSGVAMLDRALVDRRPEYTEYMASTPAFLPVPKGWRKRARSAVRAPAPRK